MYKLEDMTDVQRRRLYYSEDKTDLEAQAVEIMDSIKHLLPSKVWKLGGWVANPDNMEYEDRNAKGTARVYVRISKVDWWDFCQGCGKPAEYHTRSGFYCGDCIG